MNVEVLERWRHSHAFDPGNSQAQSNTTRVVLLTATMMVVEIAAGWWYNSMALLADGWHMSSHAVALGVTVVAYGLAQRYRKDPRFAFGTWKIEVLGGYSSALLLAVVAAFMLFESVARLFSPKSIRFDQAILVAAVGLVVNIISAWMLHGHDGNDHHDEHHQHLHQSSADVHGDHDHGHRHHDINLRSAYLHVVADATTSVLAILALLSGKYFGANWLDSVMGIVGAVLVGIWAKGLLRDSSRVLLDAEMDCKLAATMRADLESRLGGMAICDFHLWRVGKQQYACIISLASAQEISPDDVREQLSHHSGLVHATIEVNRVNSATA